MIKDKDCCNGNALILFFSFRAKKWSIMIAIERKLIVIITHKEYILPKGCVEEHARKKKPHPPSNITIIMTILGIEMKMFNIFFLLSLQQPFFILFVLCKYQMQTKWKKKLPIHAVSLLHTIYLKVKNTKKVIEEMEREKN